MGSGRGNSVVSGRQASDIRQTVGTCIVLVARWYISQIMQYRVATNVAAFGLATPIGVDFSIAMGEKRTREGKTLSTTPLVIPCLLVLMFLQKVNQRKTLDTATGTFPKANPTTCLGSKVTSTRRRGLRSRSAMTLMQSTSTFTVSCFQLLTLSIAPCCLQGSSQAGRIDQTSER